MIDPKLQTELREKFNPDGSELRQMQLRMLDMLRYIDKICRENNIKYWLSSGTCLGAVRHGGFIPWDDDTDIEMLKADYLKLRKIINRHLSDCYEWQDIETDDNYSYPFAKLRDKFSEINEFGGHDINYKYRGLFIDIFILTPSNSIKLRKISSIIYTALIRRCNKIKNRKYKIAMKKVVLNFIVPFLEIFQKIGNNDKYRHISGTYFYKYRLGRNFDNIQYNKFENTVLPIPKEYNQYLSLIYPKYEELPDVSSIRQHTSNITFLQVKNRIL